MTMTVLLLFAAILVIGVPGGQLFGWYTTAGRYGHPFNWRVFLGPTAYYRWLDGIKP